MATNTDQWKIDLGRAAVKELVKAGIVNDAETWENKMMDKAENWMFFTLLQRVIEKNK
ncbi:hypothetical protein D3C75_551440 [compost metagenome]